MKMRPWAAYGMLTAALFWLLPLMICDMGTAILALLCLMPLAVLILAFICGWKTGWDWRIPALTAALFATTVYVHYNESAWIYAVVYAGVALTGNALGALCRKCR